MVTNSPQVLAVDDEPRLCNVLRRILRQEGYRVTTVPDMQRMSGTPCLGYQGQPHELSPLQQTHTVILEAHSVALLHS